MTGEIYFKIPKHKFIKSKIILNYYKSIQELNDITKNKEDIPKQTQIKIIFNNYINQVEAQRI